MRKLAITLITCFMILASGASTQMTATPMNEDSRALMNVDSVHQQYGLTGEGITAAMWDFGIAGDHQDLGTVVTSDDAGISYHATHIAGTITGDGSLDSTLTGVAPDSRLLSYELEDSSLSGLYSETADAQSKGAVVSQNSWGWGDFSRFGNYDSFSKAYDKIVAGTAPGLDRGMTVVFSAGNYGNDVDNRYNTLPGTGATAKNSITVGAVNENSEMTRFSSWGPTDDGRIKPDIMANGQLVKSTKPGDEYGYKSGSSIAAPSITGAVILVNQAYDQVHGDLPAPAVVKAVLIHTADDISTEGPDYRSGWGVADVKAAVDKVNADGSQNVIAEDSLATGETDTFTVEDGNKVTLLWTDPAGSSLVNDLNLVVKDQDGNRYQTWRLDSSNPEAAATKGADHVNPVEQVVVPEGTGPLTVTVKGDLEQSQNYVLVADGNIATQKAQTPNVELNVVSPTDTAYSENTVDLEVEAAEAETVTYTLDDGSKQTMTGSNGVYKTSIQTEAGDHTVVFEAVNGEQSVSKQVSFSVEQQVVEDNEPPVIEVVSPERTTYRTSTIQFDIISSEELSEAHYYVDGYKYSLEKDGDHYVGEHQLSNGFQRINFRAVDKAGNTDSESVYFFVSTDQTQDTTTDSKTDSGSTDSNTDNSTTDSTMDSTTDTGSNDSTKETKDVDTTAPTVDVVKPSRSLYDSSTVELRIEASEALETASYSLDDGSKKSMTKVSDTVYKASISAEDGTHSVDFAVEDAAGNKATASEEFEVDTTSPSLELQNPSGTFSKTDVPLDYSSNERLDEVWYVVDSGDRNYISGDTTVTVSEGEHTVKLYGTDDAGNTGSASSTFTVSIPDETTSDTTDSTTDSNTDTGTTDSTTDNTDTTTSESDQPEEDTTPPELTVISPTAGSTVSGDMAWFNVSVNEEVESVKVTVNRRHTYDLEGGGVYHKKIPVKDGMNTAMFMATDTSGNFESESLVFSVG